MKKPVPVVLVVLFVGSMVAATDADPNASTDNEHARVLWDFGAPAPASKAAPDSALDSVWASISAPIGPIKSLSSKLFSNTLDKVQDVLEPLANVCYVLLMLYGFAKLPSNFMLCFGSISVFFGPSTLVICLKVLGVALSTAAYAPFIIILVAWCVIFLRSAIFQRIALAMGLDADGDGDGEHRTQHTRARTRECARGMRVWRVLGALVS